MATGQPAGGMVDAAAIRDAVEIFYERVLAEPVLAVMFEHSDMTRLRVHQRAFLLQALGGPALYSGRDLKSAHAGQQITDEHFALTLAHLLASLAQVGVAQDVIDRANLDVESLRPLIVEALD
ncbi:hypothetical protein BH09ACT4_BH09ACT4_20850 [soil metagenome]